MLQLFLSWSVLLSVCLGLVTLIGDQAELLGRTDLERAIADNATHGLIGLVTWLIVLLGSKLNNVDRCWETVICGLLSSAIDVDHFIAARSIDLQSARQLTSRPFFHCTSVPLASCCFLVVLALLIKSPALHRIAWLTIAAFMSHHSRDATRRGFWMWPFGSTRPLLPHWLYVGAIVALPHAVRTAMNATCPTSVNKSYVSVV